jgi:hypothetical protein
VRVKSLTHSRYESLSCTVKGESALVGAFTMVAVESSLIVEFILRLISFASVQMMSHVQDGQ